VHIIARFRDDAAWPNPVWGVAAARPYADDALKRFIVSLRQAIGI
jgi:diadenosine tetraphosphate (Ap4A) HIT family hydrolase